MPCREGSVDPEVWSLKSESFKGFELGHSNLPGEDNEEIKWSFSALKCILMGCVMSHSCSALYYVPNSRPLPFRVSRAWEAHVQLGFALVSSRKEDIL